MKEVFRREGVPPKAYQQLLNSTFSTEWYQWLPETLFSEIEREFDVEVSEIVRDKILAIQTFVNTDVFYHDAAAFEHIVMAVNDADVVPDEISLASPEEIVYAITTLGPVDDKQFEREVTRYIQICFENAGLLVYPSNVRFAQPEYLDERLKKAVQQVRPVVTDAAPHDLVGRQSNKLYKCIRSVVDRIAAYEPEEMTDNVQSA